MVGLDPRAVLLGAAGGAALTLVLLRRGRRNQVARQQQDQPCTASPATGHGGGDGAAAVVYEHKGLYYQLLGHAWDHETKQYKVVYRPLYHCCAKSGSFPAHVLAVSHFSRFESKFRRIANLAALPPEARTRLLSGPFVFDPDWTESLRTAPIEVTRELRRVRASAPKATVEVTYDPSGLERCHGSPSEARLEHIIGDYERFIRLVHETLASPQTGGLDARARGYEMDHICYRCETHEQYKAVLAALVPRFGALLVEGMIGARPIATVQLHTPIAHYGYEVRCIEVPCPKPGRCYPGGLEHAEIVIGCPEDGFESNARLQQFIRESRMCGLPVAERFDERALAKPINADVAVSFDDPDHPGRHFSVKFHQRPLYEVAAYEAEHGAFAHVPNNFFGAAEGHPMAPWQVLAIAAGTSAASCDVFQIGPWFVDVGGGGDGEKELQRYLTFAEGSGLMTGAPGALCALCETHYHRRLPSVARGGPTEPYGWLCNMAVVRLPWERGGGCLIYSATLDEKDSVDGVRLALESHDLLPVRLVVAPSPQHHHALSAFQRAFPDAFYVCGAGSQQMRPLTASRPDLRFDGVLTSAAIGGGENEVLMASVDGVTLGETGAAADTAWTLLRSAFDVVVVEDDRSGEVVLRHRPSNTLFVADLLYKSAESVCGPGGKVNRYTAPQWFAEGQQELFYESPASDNSGGLLPAYRTHPLVRTINVTGMRRSLEAVLGWRFERALACHTDPMEGGEARDLLRRAWAWVYDC